ncbi:MAG: hypothetical protein FWB72_06525 [Firmicutes bacterium]|nr:hypothetical protein [Bacillota bacterium]MCL2177574.1 hypothetical protein [Bacillota bacterium]
MSKQNLVLPVEGVEASQLDLQSIEGGASLAKQTGAVLAQINEPPLITFKDVSNNRTFKFWDEDTAVKFVEKNSSKFASDRFVMLAD